jgi:rRNA-processing protein CGR1
MPRLEDPITEPNSHLTGDILNPTSDPSIQRHAQKGRNASSRSWKLRPQKRASSLITSNRLNARSKSWERKTQERQLKTCVKSAQQEMLAERKAAAAEKKERRLENERRRMENEYNHAKRSAQRLNLSKVGQTMKAMNKKQLRMIKKSRMNSKTGVVEFVGAYAK